MPETSFWQRVSSVLRPGGRWSATSDGNGKNGIIQGRNDTTLSPVPTVEPAAGFREIPWWRRRAVRQAQTREASLRVIALADGLQQHFQQQDQRSAELSQSLQRVGTVLEQLAETQRVQGECLRSIATQTDAAGRHAAVISETLRRLPEALSTQAEAIRAVGKHLEISQESDTQLMHSMQRFGQAVGTLSAAGTTQVEALQHLQAAQREQHDAFSALVREQSRRFMAVLLIGAVLAVAGLAALGVTLTVRLLP